MQRSMVVPFDGSIESHSVLRRAIAAVIQAPHLYGSVIVAAAGLEPAALDAILSVSRILAGHDLELDLCLLNPAAPCRSLRSLLTHTPDATLVIPIGGRNRTPWYDEACRQSEGASRTMLFFLTPRELEPPGFDRSRSGWPRLLLNRLTWIRGRLLPWRAPSGDEPPSNLDPERPSRAMPRRSGAGAHARHPSKQASQTERTEVHRTHRE